MKTSTPPPRVLSVAGSDSSGGAGIQADLKTFAALGVWGTTAITAITAQNTAGVRGVMAVTPQLIVAQIDAVAEEGPIGAAKTGMLGNAAIVEAVASALARHGMTRLVVDPVLVAESGARLLEEEALEAMKARLLPEALVVTPNAPEAAALTGRPVEDEATARAAAENLHGLGARNVLIKGGHLAGTDATDWLYDGRDWREYTARRIEGRGVHGTGCTLAAALAAFLARGEAVPDAVARAKAFVTEAIRRAVPGQARSAANPQRDLEDGQDESV